ncbi:mCG147205 [Mus musculus]|nr:mCG147205 [Mus musculus]
MAVTPALVLLLSSLSCGCKILYLSPSTTYNSNLSFTSHPLFHQSF